METYNGFLSEAEFVDGVSVEPLTKAQAQRIAGAFRIETLDGLDPSEGAEYTAILKGVEAPAVEYAQPVVESVVYDFTRESLETIADKQGLNGLRPIGDKYGIKSNSIVSMIDKLMELTGEVKV
jgi:hypothetical protein